MATQADVRRIALALPGTEEERGRFAFSVRNKGKLKGFAWVWLERLEPKKPRVPNPAVLAVRVVNLAEKERLITADPVKFFTEPHYTGFPAVLVRLDAVAVAELKPLIAEAWRCQAPIDLKKTAMPPTVVSRRKRATPKARAALTLTALCLSASLAAAQEPVAWGSGPDIAFHTFSIVAVDPATGETGVIVTTRNPCVGNAVPWVRAGVGAVATQGGTRIEYGNELLDLLAKGVAPQMALDQVVAADSGRESRQVGVIDIKGRSAQWTGKNQYGAEKQGDWVHMRRGATFAVQGNSLVSPKVVDAVAEAFQASEGSARALADRLIDALNAGQLLGGDGRHGETQSAAVLLADPRKGMSRRPDGITVNINVCEHPEPVAELRRIYDTASETLGFRRLEQFIGRDILQLKLMLHALGYYRPHEKEIATTGTDALVYTEEAIKALDAFRAAQDWGTTVPGFVDRRVIDRLWQRLEEKGLASEVRRKLLAIQRLR